VVDEPKEREKNFGFRADDKAGVTRTSYAEPPPPLEPEELRVLQAFSEPVLLGDAFTEPAEPDEVAAQLDLAADVVAGHLRSLCAKFGIEGEDRRAQGRLVMEAMRRGAITLRPNA